MIVADTNVLVSGLITGDSSAPTALIVDAMLIGTAAFALSPELLAEYRNVLLRPALTRLHRLSVAELDALLTTLVQNAAWREPAPTQLTAPDPGDQHLWALLSAMPEAILVTGDRLLVEGPPAGRVVVYPAEYVKKIGE